MIGAVFCLQNLSKPFKQIILPLPLPVYICDYKGLFFKPEILISCVYKLV